MKADETSKLIASAGLDLRAKLDWHLRGNHYPPIDVAFIPVAMQAIQLADNGDWDTLLDYPNGLQRTVAFTVEHLHLQWFLDSTEE